MKKKIKKNKLKKTPVIIVFLVLIIIGIFIFFFLTSEDENSQLTVLDRQWIESNKNTLVDLSIPNNMSILGEDGEGLLFTLVADLESDTGLRFNKVAYQYPNNPTSALSFEILKSNETMQENDLLLIDDHYVVLALTDEVLTSEKTLYDAKIGLLKTDEATIDQYFAKASLTLQTFDNNAAAVTALKNKTVDYLILPRYASLAAYVNEDIYTVYSFENMTNKLVLRFGDNKRLNDILLKYVDNFKKTALKTTLDEATFNYYVDSQNVSEVEEASLQRKVYKYGYLEDDIYNFSRSNSYYGTAAEYVKALENMATMEFEFIAYDSYDNLLNDLKNGSLDLGFAPFTQEENIVVTNNFIDSKLIVLAKDYSDISGSFALTNRRLALLAKDKVATYLADNYHNYHYEVTNLNEVDNNSLLVMDELYYAYYGSADLDDYHILFKDNYSSSATFALNSNEEVLSELLTFTLANLDNHYMSELAFENLYNSVHSTSNFRNIYTTLLLVVLIPILLIVIIYFVSKNIRKLNILKKEDILKYNDLLTSLKNRNYLNVNIDKWDDTKVYPKTIIIADLNNLKYVNDNYGQEKGNELIKKAAAVLINTQLERSEIVRSDGNEFLIYLIGYSKTQVNTYISKLVKEFDKLPYGFGAAVGYSMIEDEIKTIDDAINEATIAMRMDKEQNYK